MDKGDAMILFGVFLGFIVLTLAFLGFFHQSKLQDYTTENIVDCNDKDGDLIEGLVCYEVLRCADKLKFKNPKGCEEFLK